MDLGGVVIGRHTSVNIIDIGGLGRPPVRDNDTERPSMDGVWPGPDYYGARSIHIEAAIKIPGNQAACDDMLAQLLEAADDPARTVGGQTTTLRYRRPGRPVKRLYGRLRILESNVKQAIYGYVPLDIQFTATDPTWYADTLTTETIPLGWLTGGGFAAPVTAPIHVQDGATAADRPGWALNQGTTDAWPIIRITGPVAQVTIRHAESGRQLAMPTLNLTTSSQWVEIDTRPGYCTVTDQNGGNASALLTPASRIDRFRLPTGQSELRWIGFDDTNTARMRLTWRDAYIAL
ncbi:hypothetical protein [Streptomyces sp. NPDC059076]|uniref:hypothetical protein n=1 Tax=unclassified Streptomyces TaxID=2593676 RepID=UPI0036957BDE